MANWALFLGVMPFALAWAMILGTQAGTEGWEEFSLAAVIITAAVCAAPGLVLGTLALVFPGHGHELRRRRIMASIGIALALLGSITIFFVMQWINSFIGP